MVFVSQGTNKAANFMRSTHKTRNRSFYSAEDVWATACEAFVEHSAFNSAMVSACIYCVSINISLSILLTRPPFRNPVSHPSTPHLHLLQLAFVHFFLQIHILTFCNNIDHKQL